MDSTSGSGPDGEGSNPSGGTKKFIILKSKSKNACSGF
jgi:hypothetical protein